MKTSAECRTGYCTNHLHIFFFMQHAVAKCKCCTFNKKKIKSNTNNAQVLHNCVCAGVVSRMIAMHEAHACCAACCAAHNCTRKLCSVVQLLWRAFWRMVLHTPFRADDGYAQKRKAECSWHLGLYIQKREWAGIFLLMTWASNKC